MGFEDALIVLSMSDPMCLLGAMNNGKMFTRENLNPIEEKDIFNKLILARNSGYKYCIITRSGIYVNSP